MAAQAKLHDEPLTTELVPLSTFRPAELEHDDFARNLGSGYLRVVVAPKVARVCKALAARLRSRAA